MNLLQQDVRTSRTLCSFSPNSFAYPYAIALLYPCPVNVTRSPTFISSSTIVLHSPASPSCTSFFRALCRDSHDRVVSDSCTAFLCTHRTHTVQAPDASWRTVRDALSQLLILFLSPCTTGIHDGTYPVHCSLMQSTLCSYRIGTAYSLLSVSLSLVVSIP